jgi:hypothetical protein
MKRISHLQKIILLGVIILLFSVGQPNWWFYVTFVCYLYYITFLANLFFKLYESENVITRQAFRPEAPMIVGLCMIVLWVGIRRINPETNIRALYYCAFAGFFATGIARFKAGRWQRR